MIRRAQLVLVGAVVLAAVIVGTQLPLGQLLSQRDAIAQQSAQLQRLKAADAALSTQVAALGNPSTVATIAHEQYGLVYKGQIAYVILPEPGAHDGTSPLDTVAVPAGDVVPSDAAVSAVPADAAATPHGPGFLQQVLDKLEFWRWAF